MLVGFGDDVAASAGLVVADGGDLLPVGDALADPLAGTAAAVAAMGALAFGSQFYLKWDLVEEEK
jgi:hypothetical protein